MNLFTLFVNISAPDGRLRRDLRRAERRVKVFAGRAGQSLGAATQATERFQAGLSKLLIPIGLVAAVSGIRNQILAAKDASDDFVKTLRDGTRDAEIELAKAAGRLDEIQAALAARQRSERDVVDSLDRQAANMSAIGNAWQIVTSQVTGALTINEKIAIAQEEQNKQGKLFVATIKEQANEAERKLRAERESAQSSAALSLQQQLVALQMEQLSAEEQINAQLAIRERTLQDLIGVNPNDQLLGLLDAVLELERNRADERIKQLQRVEQAEQESIRRNAALTRRLFSEALASSTEVFNDSTASSIDALSRRLESQFRQLSRVTGAR